MIALYMKGYHTASYLSFAVLAVAYYLYTKKVKRTKT